MSKIVVDHFGESIPEVMDNFKDLVIFLSETCFINEKQATSYRYASSVEEALGSGIFYFRTSSDLERGSLISEILVRSDKVRVFTFRKSILETILSEKVIIHQFPKFEFNENKAPKQSEPKATPTESKISESKLSVSMIHERSQSPLKIQASEVKQAKDPSSGLLSAKNPILLKQSHIKESPINYIEEEKTENQLPLSKTPSSENRNSIPIIGRGTSSDSIPSLKGHFSSSPPLHNDSSKSSPDKIVYKIDQPLNPVPSAIQIALKPEKLVTTSNDNFIKLYENYRWEEEGELIKRCIADIKFWNAKKFKELFSLVHQAVLEEPFEGPGEFEMNIKKLRRIRAAITQMLRSGIIGLKSASRELDDIFSGNCWEVEIEPSKISY